jgi:hypothetical protein
MGKKRGGLRNWLGKPKERDNLKDIHGMCRWENDIKICLKEVK